MKRINRASDTIGIKGSIPIRIETLHPKKDYTIEEQILLLYLLSLPPTWNLKQSWVIKRYIGVMGRERVKKAWASLKLKGHLVKMKGEKFTDVYWLVFESTSNNQNLDNLNSVDLELVKNNTDIIDTDNIDTDNTSSSILGKTKINKKELPQHLQPSITTQGSYLKNELIKSADFLVRATKLGAEIFEFDSESRFNKLEKLIGNEEFEKIKPALKKWILAKNQLK
jgi:hypothetical protein